MSEPVKSRNEPEKLPCLWAEGEPFDVPMKRPAAGDVPPTKDTAFLLKPETAKRPSQFPAA
jgi:hypothetical protein